MRIRIILGTVFLASVIHWDVKGAGRDSQKVGALVVAWIISVRPSISVSARRRLVQSSTRRITHPGWLSTALRRMRMSDRETTVLQEANHSPSIVLVDTDHTFDDDGIVRDDNLWSYLGDPVTHESAFPLLGIKSLGVDYGFARTGLAVTVGYEPTPLAILSGFNLTITTTNATTTVTSGGCITSNNKNWTELDRLCGTIVSYAALQSVQRIVLGLPFHKNGTVATQTMETVLFGRRLATAALYEFGTNVPVVLFDERYTSKDAALRLHHRDRQRHLYGTLDSAAAGIILENYYQDAGVGAYPIVLTESVRSQCLAVYAERQRAVHLEQETRRAESEARRLQRRRQQPVDDTAVSIDSVPRKKKKKKK